MSTPVLDLTPIPAEQRLEILSTALKGLAVHDCLEVHGGPQWDGVLPLLQEEYEGMFDWRPVEEGPARWVAELCRLEPSSQDDGVASFMMRDHHRCDALYAGAENAANEGNLHALQQEASRFFVSMAHHLRMEEEVFFPTFEDKTGMRQGPTMVMRSEHEQMRNLMRQMEEAAEKQNAELFLKAGGTLMFLMQQHNVKEEQMLYPMADMHLGGDVRAMLKNMQRV